jgi:hypothetical protein
MVDVNKLRSLMPVRVLRAHLAKMIDAEEATKVGVYGHVRAILVPLPHYRWWDHKAKKKAIAEARKRFRVAIESMA